MSVSVPHDALISITSPVYDHHHHQPYFTQSGFPISGRKDRTNTHFSRTISSSTEYRSYQTTTSSTSSPFNAPYSSHPPQNFKVKISRLNPVLIQHGNTGGADHRHHTRSPPSGCRLRISTTSILHASKFTTSPHTGPNTRPGDRKATTTGSAATTVATAAAIIQTTSCKEHKQSPQSVWASYYQGLSASSVAAEGDHATAAYECVVAEEVNRGMEVVQ